MRGYFLFIISFLVIGCSEKNKSGVDIIPRQKMAKIIWDIMLVDEFASAYIANDTSKNIKEERIKLYQKVFQVHQVSEKQFSKSFKYYSGRPDIMKVLFDTLGARAERERQNLYLPKDLQPK